MSKSSKVAKLYQLLEDIHVTGDDEPSKSVPFPYDATSPQTWLNKMKDHLKGLGIYRVATGQLTAVGMNQWQANKHLEKCDKVTSTLSLALGPLSDSNETALVAHPGRKKHFYKKKSPYLECSFCNAPAHIFLDCNDLYQAMTRRRNQRESESHWKPPPKQNAAVSIDEEKSESETEETCNAVTDGISSSISQPMTLW